MKGFGVILLIFALALLAPRESSGSRAWDASIGWKSRPLLRDHVPTLASGSHHMRSGKDHELPSRKAAFIRIGVGLALLASGILLISL
ncbi:MAG: hypothetical protein K8R99_15700 [Actinomycetia bacterium]|nr:hypothetical protein [Actinomycetes bacterium]